LVVLTRKHPELDAALTRVVEQARASDALDAAGLERMLEAVLELEKPDLDKLGVLRTGEESFAAVYRRAVLDPLYATLLQAAYRLGIREGLAAPFDASIAVPVHDAGAARRTLTRLAAVTDGVHFEAIGGFREGTPAALADVDLRLRVRARGWRVVTERRALAPIPLEAAAP